MRIQALVWIIPASAAALNSVVAAGIAGEPIRFIRPKTNDQPLRFNFAREKAGNRDGLNTLSASAPASLPASPEAPAATAQSPRDTVSARTWNALVTDLPNNTPRASDRVQPARSRRIETDNSSGGLFSGNLGLTPQGPGSVSAASANESSILGTSPSPPAGDRQTAIRSLLPDTTGKRSVSSTAFGGVDGTFSGALKQSFGSPPAPPAPGTGSRIGPGGSNSTPFPPTAGLGSAPEATPAPDDATPNNSRPNPKPPTSPSSRRVFNPAERPLHSNFELPPRPR